MSQGREYLLYVSSDGTSSGTETEVELQGDLTINPGKSMQQTVYKNGQNTSQNDSGKSISFTMGLTAPVGTGQGLLLALNDSGDTSYFWVRNSVTGGLEYAFEGKVAIQTINTPTNADASAQTQIGVQGDWTRGVAA